MMKMQRTSSMDTADSFLQLLDLLMPAEGDESSADHTQWLQPDASFGNQNIASIGAPSQHAAPGNQSDSVVVQHAAVLGSMHTSSMSRQSSGCKTSLAQRQSHQRLRARKKSKVCCSASGNIRNLARAQGHTQERVCNNTTDDANTQWVLHCCRYSISRRTCSARWHSSRCFSKRTTSSRPRCTPWRQLWPARS